MAAAATTEAEEVAVAVAVVACETYEAVKAVSPFATFRAQYTHATSARCFRLISMRYALLLCADDDPTRFTMTPWFYRWLPEDWTGLLLDGEFLVSRVLSWFDFSLFFLWGPTWVKTKTRFGGK